MSVQDRREKTDEACLVLGQAGALLRLMQEAVPDTGDLVEQLTGIERLVRDARSIVNETYSL